MQSFSALNFFLQPELVMQQLQAVMSGERYTIDFDLAHGTLRARVRSAWIILHSEGTPRLTSCYVLLD